MVLVSVDKLKNSRHFLENVRWDITPKIFINPRSPSGEVVDITHGYMFYVDIVSGKPALVIMQLKKMMSQTVGYVDDVPGDLLKEAMNCTATECVSGMYPICATLENWLKKELGLN